MYDYIRNKWKTKNNASRWCLFISFLLILSAVITITKISFLKNYLLIFEILNYLLSAILGALIGYILNEGVDELDDWFDKDIIDRFIIKNVNKAFAIFVNENRRGEDYFSYNSERPDPQKNNDNKQFHNYCWNAVLIKDLGLYGNIINGKVENAEEFKESNANKNITRPRIILEFLFRFSQPEYKNNSGIVYNYIDAELCARFIPAGEDCCYLRGFLAGFQDKLKKCMNSFENKKIIEDDLLKEINDEYLSGNTGEKAFKLEMRNFITRRPLNANKGDLERIEKDIKDEYYKQICPIITFCKEYDLINDYLDIKVKPQLKKTFDEINPNNTNYNRVSVEKLNEQKSSRYVKCVWGKEYSGIHNEYITMELGFFISNKGDIFKIILNQCDKNRDLRKKLYNVFKDNPLRFMKSKKIMLDSNGDHYKVSYIGIFELHSFNQIEYKLKELLKDSVEEVNNRLGN